MSCVTKAVKLTIFPTVAVGFHVDEGRVPNQVVVVCHQRVGRGGLDQRRFDAGGFLVRLGDAVVAGKRTLLRVWTLGAAV